MLSEWTPIISLVNSWFIYIFIHFSSFWTPFLRCEICDISCDKRNCMYTWCRVIARIIRGNQVGDIDAHTRRRSQVDRSRQFIWYAGSNLWSVEESNELKERPTWGRTTGIKLSCSGPFLFLIKACAARWIRLDWIIFSENFNSILLEPSPDTVTEDRKCHASRHDIRQFMSS